MKEEKTINQALPAKVYVGSRSYDVELHSHVSVDNALCYGSISYEESKIKICADMTLGTKQLTLLHEVTHAVAEDRNFELPEEQVDQLSRGFFCFLKDNPDFIRSILQ